MNYPSDPTEKPETTKGNFPNSCTINPSLNRLDRVLEILLSKANNGTFSFVVSLILSKPVQKPAVPGDAPRQGQYKDSQSELRR